MLARIAAPARRADHPRDHADLRHPRARLRLDARRGEGRPRAPAARRRRSSTRTPASRTTTCATTSSTSGSRSPTRAGLASSACEGTLDVLQRADRRRVDPPAADAEAVQDQHEPGDGGRHRGARRRRSRPRRRASSSAALRRPRHRRDPRHCRATCRSSPEPYDAGRRASSGMTVERPARRTCEGMVERRLLRRVAAILFHRRAGFSANGMGVWKVPEDQILEIGPRMAAVPRHLATATSARPTRTGPTRSSRWPTAARRRSATRSSTRSPTQFARDRGPRDALLLDRVQEDPPALLHRRLTRVGARARGRLTGPP